MHDRRKAKTGCITCKIRRIKCSEEKPHCVRCTSTGRKCEYQSVKSEASFDVELSLPGPTGSHPTDALPSGQLERRVFEFYFYYVGPSISGPLGHGFWSGTVLQVCRTEPLVWDAIISLGALYELMSTVGSTDKPRAQRNKRHAIMWYQRSLTTMRRKIQQGVTDLFVAMITCTLFLAIEVLQNNTSAALKLYYQGMQLVANSSGLQDSALSSRIFTDVAPVILQMGTSSLMREESRLAQSLDALCEMEVEFTTLVDARQALYAIIASWRNLDRDVDNRVRQMRRTETGGLSYNSTGFHEHLAKRQQEIEQRLRRWEDKFGLIPAVISYQSRRTKTNNSKMRRETDTTNLDNDEMGYDLHEELFREIIAHATMALADTVKRAPFTFDMGIGLPLFVTALKCRNHVLRRDALSCLHQTSRLQGMYNCSAAAQIATTIIALEDGAAITPSIASSSTEKHRDNQVQLSTREAHAESDSFPIMQERRIRDFTLSSQRSDNSLGNMSNFGTTWLNFTYYLQDTHTKDATERTSIPKFITHKVPLPDTFSWSEYQLVLDYYRSFRSTKTSDAEDHSS